MHLKVITEDSNWFFYNKQDVQVQLTRLVSKLLFQSSQIMADCFSVMLSVNEDGIYMM